MRLLGFKNIFIKVEDLREMLKEWMMPGKEFKVEIPFITTPWFPLYYHPKRIGFYECRDDYSKPADGAPPVGTVIWLDFWDGKGWVETNRKGRILNGGQHVVRERGFWRGLSEIPTFSLPKGGIAIPEEHRPYLFADFLCEVPIDDYPPSELHLLCGYGTLMSNLMSGCVEAVSNDEKRFVEMCDGKRNPISQAEFAWKRYRLDVMYKATQEMETSACIRGTYDFEQYRERFLLMATHGHLEARVWVKDNGGRPEGFSITKSPFNLRDVYPPKVKSTYMKRMNGSFGGGGKG